MKDLKNSGSILYSFIKQYFFGLAWLKIIKHFHVYVEDNIVFLCANTNTILVYKIENVNFVQNSAHI